MDTDYIFDINMNIIIRALSERPSAVARRLEGKLKQPPTPKVPGSNPGPGTKQIKGLRVEGHDIVDTRLVSQAYRRIAQPGFDPGAGHLDPLVRFLKRAHLPG